MDLEKYRILLRVVQTNSLTQAADEMGYSVSGISRLINTLEREQGFALIYRNHDGIKPTKEMETLMPHLQELLYQERIVQEVADRIRGAKIGTITIGVAYSNYYPWIADRAKSFQVKYPDIRFRFVDGYSTELLQKLETHELDLCLISEREGKNHKWKQLGEEELVFWLPEGHPLANQERIPLKMVEEENYIDIYPGEDVDNNRILAAHKITPNSCIAVGDSVAAYSMVEAGLGICLNQRSNVGKLKGNVTVRPTEPKITVPVGVCVSKNITPVVEEFWEFLDANR